MMGKTTVLVPDRKKEWSSFEEWKKDLFPSDECEDFEELDDAGVLAVRLAERSLGKVLHKDAHQ